MSVREAVLEPMLLRGLDRVAAKDRLDSLLERVGIGCELVDRLPSALSGGQHRAATFHAAAASIYAMIAASIEANDAAWRAHEISPILGRMADAIIERAANDAMQGIAA